MLLATKKPEWGYFKQGVHHTLAKRTSTYRHLLQILYLELDVVTIPKSQVKLLTKYNEKKKEKPVLGNLGGVEDFGL